MKFMAVGPGIVIKEGEKKKRSDRTATIVE
jgi:hypothetical protein